MDRRGRHAGGRGRHRLWAWGQRHHRAQRRHLQAAPAARRPGAVMPGLLAWFITWAVGAFLFLTVVAYGEPPQPAPPQPYRVDTFDRFSNRTGYVIVDPRTGR